MSTPICSLVTTKTITILAGATGLSDVIDLDGYTIFALEMPATWIAANITLQACSTPTGTFRDVYDDAGSEVTIVAAASRFIAVDSAMLKIAPLRYVKFRSGTTASPVNQTATRTITLQVKG